MVTHQVAIHIIGSMMTEGATKQTYIREVMIPHTKIVNDNNITGETSLTTKKVGFRR